jgi:curved DNA-binding protein
MQIQDYYTLLGISKNASSDAIRKAYRKAARKFHPDINKDPEAEDRFKEIGEAYEVLKDAEKRKLYNQYGSNYKDAQNSEYQQNNNGFSTNKSGPGNDFHFEGGGFTGGEDINDILKNMFGSAGQFENGQGTSGWQQAGAGFQETPTEYELQVSLEDVYFGAVKHISLQTWEPDTQGGMKQVSKELKVTVPQGVTDGSVIRIGGTGGVNEKLHIRLNIAAHKQFRVVGYDLKTAVAVSPWEAILGVKIPVETMDGKVNLTIPKGTQNGLQLRVKGKGLKRKNGKAGDIIVTLDVCLPGELNEEEEQLIRSLAEKLEFNPRKTRGQQPASTVAA